jgi:Mg-chelatase subunit ChlD
MVWLTAILGAVLVLPVSATGPVPIDAPPDNARARLETRAIRIVPVRGATPDRCLEMEAADLKVQLRGKPVLNLDSIRLRRERKPANHAVLLDSSGSMVGQIDFAREAALEYIRNLSPQDPAMVLQFDDSVIMVSPLTIERESLAEAVRQVRLGGNTSLVDAIVRGMTELSLHPERPVVIVLTDGADSASLYQESDLFQLLAARPDMALFTIGYAMPEVAHAGHRGSPKRLLQRLAYRSGGKYFDVPVGSQVSGVYTRVRQLLEAEAVLTVVDPQPDLAPGRLKVRSAVESCRVEILPSNQADPEAEPYLPADRYGAYELKREYEPRCASGADGRAAVLPGAAGFHLCFQDVVMSTGSLYDPWDALEFGRNRWLTMDVRPAWVPVPAFDQLPSRPVDLMAGLGQYALEVAASEEPPGDPRMVPLEDHARPYSDYEGVVDGERLLEIRSSLVEEMAARQEYRSWAAERLRLDGGRELDRLRDRFLALAPDLRVEALERMVVDSPEGVEIVRWMSSPEPADLTRYLGAWLGDIPAADLFRDWEMQQIDQALAGRPDPDFVEQWVELRKIFYVPSYARVLGLPAPVHDRRQNRVGFWRVVLPRPAWILKRPKGLVRHPDWNDLPLDLLPERPFAFEVVLQQLDRLSGGPGGIDSYQVRDLVYELTGKPRRQKPDIAWESARFRLVLVNKEGGEERTVTGTVPPPDR